MPFKQIETQELPDIQSVGTIYEHEETGAKVLYLANDDPNKAFTIGFKTPPYNDNGIAHILEHAVLNGSKKYPSKEPFVELIKGSLNTFVNAMTFSDKTIYPVASTNQKDFNHLMSVYLDAVFQPKIYEDPQILAQEGWHYHLENPEDDLIYKGVVYNEMKGATASPERQLYKELSKRLYSNSIYQYESGGEPRAIPTLTQTEFMEFHQKYYHPSNSLTIVYGDIDEKETFDALEDYFGGKGRQEESVDLSFEAEAPEDPLVQETYSITAGDDPMNKDYLALGWHAAYPEDTLTQYGLQVLEEILFGNNQSPLKKALLDVEVGGDIDGGVYDMGYPAAFTVMAKYSDSPKMDYFIRVVEETLQKLVDEGIDEELIQAALNKITFNTKEAAISEDNPRGVIYAISALSTWLYDESPFVNLEFSTYLNQLNELAKEGYFERLIEEKLLNNPKRVEVILKAEPGKNDELEEETLKTLQQFKAELSEEEVEEIVAETQDLIKRQETPDKPEDLAKIPTLTKDDLSTDVPDYPLEVTPFGDETFFYHAEQFTSGIDYVNLYFDMSDFTEEEYPMVSFLSSLLGELATKTYDAATLQRKIDLYTGGIYGTVTVYEDDKQQLKPYFVLRGKALESSLSELIDLMREIIAFTKFSEKGEILNITQRLISDFEDQINYRSHVIAANRALSQVKPGARLTELMDGIDQFHFLKDVREKLRKQKSIRLSDSLLQILKKLLNKHRMHVLYVGDKTRAERVKDELKEAFSEMKQTELGEPASIQPAPKQNEAFVAAQDVNYVGAASDAHEVLEYSGNSKVLASAIRYNYLWNEIRVKGGAYGSLYNHRRNGNFALGSYRDPNIKKTLEVYENLPAFVEQLELPESELTKYIIGTISPMEQPKSAFSKGLTAFARLQTGVTKEELVTLKEEIIQADSQSLSALHEQIADVLEDHTVVVIGNKTQIENEKDLFDEIYELY